MVNQHKPPAMSQKIFSLNLSTETISVYLLCCGLTDAGATLSTANLLDIWNGSEASLQEGLEDLEKKQIVKKIISDRDSRDIYILTSTADWEET
jgi:hypothetical protein